MPRLGAVELAVACSGVVVRRWGGRGRRRLLRGADRRRGRAVAAAPGTPCGCLGAAPTPASGAHVALNASAAIVAAIVATGPAPLVGPRRPTVARRPVARTHGVRDVARCAHDGRTARARARRCTKGVRDGRPRGDRDRRARAADGARCRAPPQPRRDPAATARDGCGLDPDSDVGDAAPVSLRPRGDLRDADVRPRSGARYRRRRAPRRRGARPVVDVRHRTLLAFLSSGCLTCHTFWEAFADAPSLSLPDDVRIVVVTKDAQRRERQHAPRSRGAGSPGRACRARVGDLRGAGIPVLRARRRPLGPGAGRGHRHDVAAGPRHDRAVDRRRCAIALDDLDTEARIDQELLAHGIRPGDASLYPAAADANENVRA